MAEYKEALGILADSSGHITLIAEAIKKNVLPKLKNKNSMLDVGAGMGVLTKQLASSFKKTSVLEVNHEVENQLRDCGYDVTICDFFKFETQQKYDLVLCSHVMYHFDESQMVAFIEKLRSMVAPGGYCFIALIAPRGMNHDFHIRFNPEYVNSQQIIELLHRRNISFEKFQAEPYHITTETIYKMKSLLKFFLVENCQTKSTASLQNDEMQNINALAEAEAQKCKISDGYDFQQEDDYIVMQNTIPEVSESSTYNDNQSAASRRSNTFSR